MQRPSPGGASSSADTGQTKDVIVVDSGSDSDNIIRGGESVSDPAGNKNVKKKSGEHPIDEQGDLRLIVTAGPRIREVFKVDSRALARSSEFWNKLIEAKKEEEKETEDGNDGDPGGKGKCKQPVRFDLPRAAAAKASTSTAWLQAVHGQISEASPRQPAKQVPFTLPNIGGPSTSLAVAAEDADDGSEMELSPLRTIQLDLSDQRAHVASLGTLLYAAHGRLDRVPTHPTLREFCSLAVLANRCDMVPIMRGHIHAWLHTAIGADEEREESVDVEMSEAGPSQDKPAPVPGVPPGLFTQLRIFWEVGNQAEFQKTLAMLVWHTQDSGGELVCNLQNSRLPRPLAREEVVAVTDIQENITNHRLRVITLALGLLQQRLFLMEGPMPGKKRPLHQISGGDDGDDTEKGSCAVPSRTGPDCDALHYGLLVQELGRCRVDPHALPPPASVRKSPHALCALLEIVHDSIDTRTQQMQNRFLQGHNHCNPLSPMIVQLKTLRDSDAVELTEAQRKHFQEQSQKMGKKYR